MPSDAIIIFLYAFVVLFTINLFYKLLVNQGQARQIRENVEMLNKQLREEQKKGNMEKANAMLGDIMREQGKIMRMSLKPLLVSFIIVAVFLSLIGGAYGDKNVELADGKGMINLNGQDYAIEKTDSAVKIGDVECTAPCRNIIGDAAWDVSADGNKLSFVRIVAFLPVSLPLIGAEAGFLGWYILVSIPTMMMIRKLMKIYS